MSRYRAAILETVKNASRPLRHRDIAELIAPGNPQAWNLIGTDLTKLYRAGELAREKIGGYWHYSMPADPTTLLLCPFCGGAPIEDRALRDGYANYPSDPDAYAYFIICRSCAAQGGWAKSASGGRRRWNMRVQGSV
jgi:hypothetical protein